MLSKSDRKGESGRSLSYERTQDKPMYKASCRLIEAPDIDFPFKPQIRELPFELYKDRSKVEMSKEEILERLIDNRREEQERRLR